MQQPASLIPPRRLGALLSEARARGGETLEDLAVRSGGRFNLSVLSSIELGSRDVTDEDARVLVDLYGLETTSLVPPRSKLIVDLAEGLLSVDGHRASVPRGAPARDEVLARYLTMVYSMRRVEPGSSVVLRVEDLDVLGRALRVGTDTLEADLDSLMSRPQELLGWRDRLLSRRVLIPAAGVLVAVLGVGALVLVDGPPPASRDRAPVTVPAAEAAELGYSGEAPATVDVGAAVVQERNPDGTPGPVVVRNGADSTPDAPGGGAEVGLIAPETTVRGN